MQTIFRHANFVQTVTALWIFGALLLVSGVPSGCTSTNSTERTPAMDDTAAVRQISEEAALADFDRAWELVYETHFDPNFNGVDWLAVRDELRPKASLAGTRREIRMVMQEMLARLGQSHFGIIPSTASETAADMEAVPEAGTEQVRVAGLDEHAASPRDASAAEMNADGYREIEVVVPKNNGDGQGNGDTGIDLRVLNGHAVVSDVRESSPAERAGVKTGWILSSIRDHDVDTMLDELREAIGEKDMGIYAVSMLRDRLGGREGSRIDLTFLDGSEREVAMDVKREPMPGEFVKFGNLPPMSTHLEWSRESFADDQGKEVEIGIIRFNIWMIPIAPKFERAMYELRDADGVIIDLRGNPGGVGALSSALSRFIVNEKASLGTMTMRGAEMSFNIEPVIVTTWGDELAPFVGPVAILQDTGSASTSEVFTGGLQSLGRVKVFGTRSAGMALPANMDKLPSGDVLLHAIADFVTSTGARMEHGGVVPDFEVELTREDLLDGIDSPEQAAKIWISNQTRPR